MKGVMVNAIYFNHYAFTYTESYQHNKNKGEKKDKNWGKNSIYL
jgi:hypothetical protein